MFELNHTMQTFPSIKIPSQCGGLPIEVSLIAQLDIGSGNNLFTSVSIRQQSHADFVDELDEPSAKLAGTNFKQGDATSLYTFVVGKNGHPFHRHEGHRIFTAVAGSAGAQLRFSTASPEQINATPQAFFDALRYVNIPPDCMFTVRFGGGTWHQFSPLTPNSQHPAFFAISCHTNELGGNLSEDLKNKVIANQATIPALTELLPESVKSLQESAEIRNIEIPTMTLALYVKPNSLKSRSCKAIRKIVGVVRSAFSRWRGVNGFAVHNDSMLTPVKLTAIPDSSLLRDEFKHVRIHHEDTFGLTLRDPHFRHQSASVILNQVLEGFLENSPTGVARMMAFRNFVVKPLGLRTSPLGCPASSLLSRHDTKLFSGCFPVHAHQTNSGNSLAQVILGADDKHLKFRSCVGVELLDQQTVRITLGTRVQCLNIFGILYMAIVDRVHRAYIAPAMLKYAVAYAIKGTTAYQPAFALHGLSIGRQN